MSPRSNIFVVNKGVRDVGRGRNGLTSSSPIPTLPNKFNRLNRRKRDASLVVKRKATARIAISDL